MLFNRDEMQPRAARWVAPPRLPGGEEIEAEAETGLQDDEAAAPGPALRKVVPPQKDMLCLSQPARGAVHDHLFTAGELLRLNQLTADQDAIALVMARQPRLFEVDEGR